MGFFSKLFRKKAFTAIKHEEFKDIISDIENGGSYHIEGSTVNLDIYKNYLIYTEKLYGDIQTTVRYDSNDLASFQVANIENDFRGAANTLTIQYQEIGLIYNKSIVISYNRSKKRNIEKIVDFLNSKLEVKKEYDMKQKEFEEKLEYERVNGKYRYSKSKFYFFDEDAYLKYSYYDVVVKGTEHREFDISKIAIDTCVAFRPEPENEYDNKAIQVVYGDTIIGYVPKNNLQNMIHSYLNNNEAFVEGYISSVNEDSREIQIAIGFYHYMTASELKKITYVDASLIKTSKKDILGTSRQDNLEMVEVGTVIDLEYDYETETYYVTDEIGNELGEINTSKSAKLQEYEEEGNQLHGLIIDLNCSDSGKYTCKVRVLAR